MRGGKRWSHKAEGARQTEGNSQTDGREEGRGWERRGSEAYSKQLCTGYHLGELSDGDGC